MLDADGNSAANANHDANGDNDAGADIHSNGGRPSDGRGATTDVATDSHADGDTKSATDGNADTASDTDATPDPNPDAVTAHAVANTNAGDARGVRFCAGRPFGAARHMPPASPLST